MKRLLSLVLLGSLLGGCVVAARPRPAHVWVRAHWDGDGPRRVWIAGHWA